MRLIRKYKIYTKTRNISRYPSRVLKFKRSKWLKIKNLVLRQQKNTKRKFAYPNSLIIKVNKGRFDRLRLSYTNKILKKRLLLIELNLNKRRIKTLTFQNEKIRLARLRSYFKQMYYLDYAVLMHKLSSSVPESKEHLRQKKLLVNNNVASSKTIKKGDFVHIKDKVICYKSMLNKYTRSRQFSSFTEFDPYSQSFVVLKNADEITNLDFSLSIGAVIKLK